MNTFTYFNSNKRKRNTRFLHTRKQRLEESKDSFKEYEDLTKVYTKGFANTQLNGNKKILLNVWYINKYTYNTWKRNRGL